MKILAAQKSKLDAQAEEAFVARVAAHLREVYPDLVRHLSEGALAEHVWVAVARGRSHGLSWQSALTGFVELMFAVGPEFDRHPAFARALATRDEDENERIFAVYDDVDDDEWEEAQRQDDERGWDSLFARGAS